MSYEYVANGQKVVLEVDEDLVAVRFAEPAEPSTRAEVAALPELASFDTRIEIPEENFTILPVAQVAQPRHERYMAAVAQLNQSEQVERVAPVFKIGNAKAVATDRLLLGTQRQGKAAKKFLRDQGLKVLEEFGDNNEFMVKLPPEADPFAVMGELQKLAEITYVEPDFVILGKHTARLVTPAPNADDPLLPHQYAPTITKAVDAWQVQQGKPTVKIAILDEGADIQHEDLKAAIVGSYDATDDDQDQTPNDWDAHGTACAGLAMAIPNNNRGVRGIGGGCSLLAIRIAYAPSQGADWVTFDSWIRRAIDWAWRNQADVLSNSWGGGAPSTAITQAFERARTRGRNGKGSVVVIAAGNDSGPVSFPGTLSNVLTVSASNEYDEFKTFTSRDGENWWGSNFGPEIAVAAPGVHNYTTDITGEAGYNQQLDGNYIPDFNGTSSATPIVAGAAGLILSANPDLSEAEVRRIICETADKVGKLPYFQGRNDQMGYGRLNVARAVEAARRRKIGSPSHNGHAKAAPLITNTQPVHDQIEETESLTLQERTLLVDQALTLIDNFYVHLPLKRAMHAVDPLQRLKLLKYRQQKLSDRRFHNEMLSIFTSLRDLHTNYLLPKPYNRMGVYLPFLVEEFYDNGQRKYMASKMASGFTHPTFVPGVIITHWNGMPFVSAVALNAERNAGSNEEARQARGLEAMTVRPLIMALPPDEEWVDVRYEAQDGSHEYRFTWQALPIATGMGQLFDGADTQVASMMALDIQTEAARRMKKVLFAPAEIELERQTEAYLAAGADAPVSGPDLTQVSLLPDNFEFRAIDTAHDKIGYIRIYSFAPPKPDAEFVNRFVKEFMRILGLMPPTGLIIDVRGNGGGYITAGEKILQLLTSKRIEPERLHFVNTPLTLQLCKGTPWLGQWTSSVQLAVETGDIFSQGFGLEAVEEYNQIGQKYHGPVVLVTDALCYSTTDIFAAGFQDHEIGPILGVHANTGAGGANVWSHGLLRELLPNEPLLRPLPKEANFRVAIRRTSRVGVHAGLPLEDLGVTPDEIYHMTQRDLLQDNVDLIEKAASLLLT
ncbi:MAG: S8 family serine peptidase [Caldilineaceae bacterium]